MRLSLSSAEEEGQRLWTVCIFIHREISTIASVLDSKVHGANMEPTWGRQDPGGANVDPTNLALQLFVCNYFSQNDTGLYIDVMHYICTCYNNTDNTPRVSCQEGLSAMRKHGG